jgi:hypothetical protein
MAHKKEVQLEESLMKNWTISYIACATVQTPLILLGAIRSASHVKTMDAAQTFVKDADFRGSACPLFNCHKIIFLSAFIRVAQI